jgi:hypothetical protein
MSPTGHPTTHLVAPAAEGVAIAISMAKYSNHLLDDRRNVARLESLYKQGGVNYTIWDGKGNADDIYFFSLVGDWIFIAD